MDDAGQIDSVHSDRAGNHAEHRGMQALRFEFVVREEELVGAVAHLTPDEQGKSGRIVIARGDSGTGKTFFSRELMRRLGRKRPTALCLYVDISNDEYQSSRTIAALLKMSLVPGPMTQTSVISVPESISLMRYRKKVKGRRLGRDVLKNIARAAGTFFGFGSAVNAALDDLGKNAGQLEDELVGYLSWVAKKEMVFIAVDNLQFLNLEVRLTIESILDRVDRNIRLIAVDRTVDGVSQLDPPIRCFGDHILDVQLNRFTAGQTRELVASSVGDANADTSKLADDIFTKTDGLAKDIEYCLRQYSLELGRGARVSAIEGLLATIDRLPLIHRQFLVIATLLDGGIKKTIAQSTVRRLASLYDEHSLDKVVEELVASEYLRINSESGDRLRPGHERIATAMSELTDEDLHEEVRRSLVQELVAAVEEVDIGENETYLLHCLVGLQTARELSKSLHYISRLIQSQYRQDQFSYLVALTAELREILPLLPEHVLVELLDAMQKSSAFDQGLALVRLLDAEGVPGSEGRKIYRLKYLTQAYAYDEALSLSEDIGEEGWGAVYRINALMSLARNGEARVIADAQLSDEPSECQAVLRRNTITLFDSDTALRHLDESYRYFEEEESAFRLATVDTNRSLVYLCRGQFGDALRCLDKALERMAFIGSQEIFQAQINFAVRSALLGNFDEALDWLNEAKLRVPRALLLDQVKIEMDSVVIEAAAEKLTSAQAEQALNTCLRRIQGVQMPEIRNALAPNLAVARGEHWEGHPPDSEQVSPDLGMRIGFPVSGKDWTLLMSIHWRY